MTVGKSKGYGCYDRKDFRKEVVVQDGWHWKGGDEQTKKVVRVPFLMEKDCQYTLSELGQKDERCIGCKWRK